MAADIPHSASVTTVPVFSRLLHVDKIPYGDIVECRIRANDRERVKLAKYLEIEEVVSLTANLTARHMERHSLLVKGLWRLEAKLLDDSDPTETFSEEFDMTWLNNYRARNPVEYEFRKWDDEVPPSGNIDIGGIVTDFVGMNLDYD